MSTAHAHKTGDAIPKGLSQYKDGENLALEEHAQFSPKYQAFRLFQTCLMLQAADNYPRARKTFYDSLGWFTVLFDEDFPIHSKAIIDKYSDPIYTEKYTYEQIEQMKYMRIVTEFSRMLLDASSRSRSRLNTNPHKRAELVPIGYAQIFDFEHMALEFYVQLAQIQRQRGHKEVVNFFNHSIPWFGGIFDAKFVMKGYTIQNTDMSRALKYRKLVGEFSKLLTRKSITPTAFATLVYKPMPNEGTPHSVDDVTGKKPKGQENESLKKIADSISQTSSASIVPQDASASYSESVSTIGIDPEATQHIGEHIAMHNAIHAHAHEKTNPYKDEPVTIEEYMAKHMKSKRNQVQPEETNVTNEIDEKYDEFYNANDEEGEE